MRRAAIRRETMDILHSPRSQLIRGSRWGNLEGPFIVRFSAISMQPIVLYCIWYIYLPCHGDMKIQYITILFCIFHFFYRYDHPAVGAARPLKRRTVYQQLCFYLCFFNWLQLLLTIQVKMKLDRSHEAGNSLVLADNPEGFQLQR